MSKSRSLKTIPAEDQQPAFAVSVEVLHQALSVVDDFHDGEILVQSAVLLQLGSFGDAFTLEPQVRPRMQTIPAHGDTIAGPGRPPGVLAKQPHVRGRCAAARHDERGQAIQIERRGCDRPRETAAAPPQNKPYTNWVGPSANAASVGAPGQPAPRRFHADSCHASARPLRRAAWLPVGSRRVVRTCPGRRAIARDADSRPAAMSRPVLRGPPLRATRPRMPGTRDKFPRESTGQPMRTA